MKNVFIVYIPFMCWINQLQAQCDTTSILCDISNSNLVVNGNFEQGNQFFFSNYSFVASPNLFPTPAYGHYGIRNSPNTCLPLALNCKDHTSGTGLMLVADGHMSANKNLWAQTMNVLPNTQYTFTYWISAIVTSDPYPANIEAAINGISLGTNQISPVGCSWNSVTYKWTSGNTASASIELKNLRLTGDNNDVIIDDISLKASECLKDTLHFNVSNYNGIDSNSFRIKNYSTNVINSLSVSFSKPFFSTNIPPSLLPNQDLNIKVVFSPGDSCKSFSTFGYMLFSAPCPNYISDTIWLKGTYTPPPLNASFSSLIYSGVAPLTVKFNNTSTGLDTLIYSWNFGDGGSSSDMGPIHEFSTPGEYDVTLIVTNNHGCADTIVKTYTVYSGEKSLWFPNVFTPNGDNINDYFFGSGLGIREIEIEIFNRWGGLVARWLTINGRWDGRYNGEDVAQGVYVYVARGTFEDNTSFEKHGIITLFR